MGDITCVNEWVKVIESHLGQDDVSSCKVKNIPQSVTLKIGMYCPFIILELMTVSDF